MPDALSDPLAQELARLAPAPTAVTPAAVLFAAGVQSAELKAWRWRMATGVMAIVFVCSWVGMTLRPDVELRENRPFLPANQQTYAQTEAIRASQPAPIEREPPTLKPIPPILALSQLDDEMMDLRIRGIRLRQDILAGGLGLIPDSSRFDRTYGPYFGQELNPTVLGGHYTPKKAEPHPDDPTPRP